MSHKGMMTAQHDWIIIEKFTPDATTSSGIIVNSSEDPDLGCVISVGPLVTSVKVADIVAPDWSKAILVRHMTCAVRDEDIVAVVSPAEEA